MSTSSANPFAPPQAAVDDVAEQGQEYQQTKVLSFQGRIGRLRFLAYTTLSNLAIYIPAAMVMGAVGPGPVTGAVYLLALLVQLLVLGMFAAKRSHDMDWNGWTALLALIPFVNFIWVFKSGSKGRNNYGAPPPPNTLLIKIFGWILPVIMLIGIVAAVAFPAYSDYAIRVRAQQVQQQVPGR